MCFLFSCVYAYIVSYYIYVLPTFYSLSFFLMKTLDLSRSLAPVINISDVPTLEAMLRASTCERISIAIERIPDPGKVNIPIRIIEGMETVAERGTVTRKQAHLLEVLVDLLRQSPALKLN